METILKTFWFCLGFGAEFRNQKQMMGPATVVEATGNCWNVNLSISWLILWVNARMTMWCCITSAWMYTKRDILRMWLPMLEACSNSAPKIVGISLVFFLNGPQLLYDFCSHASKEKAKRHHRKSPHRPRKQKKHNYMCIYILYTYIIIYIVILNLYILFYICFL